MKRQSQGRRDGTLKKTAMVLTPKILFLAPIIILTSGCNPTTGSFYNFSPAGDKSAIEVNRIVNAIACEIEDAVRYARTEFNLKWIENWGAIVSLKITVDDEFKINPGVSIKDIRAPAVTVFSNALVATTGQVFTLNIGGSAKQQNTSTETYEFFFFFREEFFSGKYEPCNWTKISEEINSQLNIKEWVEKSALTGSTAGTLVDHFGGIGNYKVISKDYKFVVAFGGGVTPTWNLVDITANNTSPLIHANRINTDYLLITMGPVEEISKRKVQPIAAVENVHLAAQIGQEVSAALRGE